MFVPIKRKKVRPHTARLNAILLERYRLLSDEHKRVCYSQRNYYYFTRITHLLEKTRKKIEERGLSIE